MAGAARHGVSVRPGPAAADSVCWITVPERAFRRARLIAQSGYTQDGSVKRRSKIPSSSVKLRNAQMIYGMCRLFLLSQTRAQGDVVAGPREVSATVPLDHIPELMCAMGYYPTQSDITDIISSLASAAALRKEPKPTTVNLEKLLYLYHNFSPVDGVRVALLFAVWQHFVVGSGCWWRRDWMSRCGWLSAAWSVSVT